MFVITKSIQILANTLGKWRFWTPNNGGLVQIMFLFLCILWRWHRRIFFRGCKALDGIGSSSSSINLEKLRVLLFSKDIWPKPKNNTAQNNSAFQYGESRDSRSKRFVKIVWDQLTCQAGNSYKPDFPIWNSRIYIHTKNNPLPHVRSSECKISIFVVRTLFLKQSHQKMIKKSTPQQSGG